MAKKVKEQVVIKDEELTPTTIGIYSNKGKSPIGLILILLIFLALLIFLPNIETYYNKLTGKDDEPVLVSEEEDADDDEESSKVTKYPISAETVIETDSYTISNIGLSSNILTLSIANNTSNPLDLDDYYLELYNDADSFIERVKVSDEVLTASSSDNFTYTIKTQPTKLVFIERTKDDYPDVSISNNALVCIKGVEDLTYTFSNDSLTKIKYTYTANNVSDENYNIELYNKQKQSQSYNNLDGVTANISSLSSGYSFTVNIDLAAADITKIDLDGLFKKGVKPSEVKFKAEAKGYSCK